MHQVPENSFHLLRINIHTQAKHRHEVFWQITVPCFVVGILIIGVGILSAMSGNSSASIWADISLMFLIIIASVGALFLLVIFAASTFGVWKLIGIMPPYTALIQDYFMLAQYYTLRYSNFAVEPVIRSQGWSAQAIAIKKEIQKNLFFSNKKYPSIH